MSVFILIWLKGKKKTKTYWAFVIIIEMLFFKISYLSVSILNFF